MKSFVHRPEASVVVASVLLIAFFAIGTNGLWLQSIPSILRITAQLGVVAIGQAILITSGEVDLSVGSVFAITGVAFILSMDALGLSVITSILLALLSSAAIGLMNALLTVRFRVPSMIVTLGGMFVFRGITYLQTHGFSLSIPHDFRDNFVVQAFKARLWGLNGSVVVLALTTLLSVYILNRTRFGSHVQAVGGNPAAALANGVSPGFVKARAFLICSVLAGVSAIMVVCQEGSIYSTSGSRMELETIAAAVIGGCALRGGIGSIWGTVLGVFVLASLKSGLVLLGAPTSWYIAFVGAILIAFLVVASVLRKSLGVTV